MNTDTDKDGDSGDGECYGDGGEDEFLQSNDRDDYGEFWYGNDSDNDNGGNYDNGDNCNDEY